MRHLFPVFACSQDPCVKMGAWCQDRVQGIGVSDGCKPAVGGVDPPAAGCSLVSTLLPVWMRTRIQPCPGDPPHPTPISTKPTRQALKFDSTSYCIPQPSTILPLISGFPRPLIAFFPLFSQCEKFDNVHKRNSRIAAGYGKSTCGSSLPPLWRRLGIFYRFVLSRRGCRY